MELMHDNIIQYIIDEFPQLIHEYKDKYEWAKVDGVISTYMFFGPIVREHFFKLVALYCNESNENTLLEIRRFSKLFESMATSQDFDLRNLLTVGVFEGMESYLNEFAMSILGPETKKLLQLRLMEDIQMALRLKPTGVLDITTYHAIINLATSRKKGLFNIFNRQ